MTTYSQVMQTIAQAEADGRELIRLTDFEGLTDIRLEILHDRIGALPPLTEDLYHLGGLALRCCGGRLPYPDRLHELRATGRLAIVDGEHYSVLGPNSAFPVTVADIVRWFASADRAAPAGLAELAADYGPAGQDGGGAIRICTSALADYWESHPAISGSRTQREARARLAVERAVADIRCAGGA